LLDKSYPGEHIGVEPTTDRFVSVMHGTEERVIPGNAAAVNQELPFRGLNRFGQAFLSRFQVHIYSIYSNTSLILRLIVYFLNRFLKPIHLYWRI
jgi:hypothetical protein